MVTIIARFGSENKPDPEPFIATVSQRLITGAPVGGTAGGGAAGGGAAGGSTAGGAAGYG